MNRNLEQRLARALSEIETLKQENHLLKLELLKYKNLEKSEPVDPLPISTSEKEQAPIGQVHLHQAPRKK